MAHGLEMLTWRMLVLLLAFSDRWWPCYGDRFP